MDFAHRFIRPAFGVGQCLAQGGDAQDTAAIGEGQALARCVELPSRPLVLD